MKSLHLIPQSDVSLHYLTLRLETLNKKAIAHTFSAKEIMDIVEESEQQILALVGSKKNAVGAQTFTQSGGSVPNAYKYARQVNSITLTRKSNGWHLTSLECFETHRKNKDKLHICFTDEQNFLAVENFRKSYIVKGQ